MPLLRLLAVRPEYVREDLVAFAEVALKERRSAVFGAADFLAPLFWIVRVNIRGSRRSRLTQRRRGVEVRIDGFKHLIVVRVWVLVRHRIA